MITITHRPWYHSATTIIAVVVVDRWVTRSSLIITYHHLHLHATHALPHICSYWCTLSFSTSSLSLFHHYHSITSLPIIIFYWLYLYHPYIRIYAHYYSAYIVKRISSPQLTLVAKLRMRVASGWLLDGYCCAAVERAHDQLELVHHRHLCVCVAKNVLFFRSFCHATSGTFIFRFLDTIPYAFLSHAYACVCCMLYCTCD